MTDNKEVILQSRIEQLESEKAELIEIAREYMGLLLSYELHDFWNDCDINEGERIKELLKKHGVEILTLTNTNTKHSRQQHTRRRPQHRL